MATLQEPSHGKQIEGGGGSVKKTIALKLKTTKKEEEQASASPAPPEVAPTVEEENPAITKPVSVGVPTLQQDDSGFAVDSSCELKWDVTMNIVGRTMIAPILSVCPQCDLPVLIYGRMKKCKHALCRSCAKKGEGTCPMCGEAKQEFEDATMGNLFICNYGGGRYDNKGCMNSYRSKRDLEAHVQFRHASKMPGPAPQHPPVGGQVVPQVTAPASMAQFQFNPATAVAMAAQMGHPGMMGQAALGQTAGMMPPPPGGQILSQQPLPGHTLPQLPPGSTWN